ncbi:MAG: hypothetical protein M3373_05680 [Gemmatimonadota bacterium]|nr:hypothetical protein [Gemmatimonadota bacterium]
MAEKRTLGPLVPTVAVAPSPARRHARVDKPRVQTALTSPFTFFVALTGANVPQAAFTVQLTEAFAIGLPPASITRAVRGAGSGCPAIPDC